MSIGIQGCLDSINNYLIIHRLKNKVTCKNIYCKDVKGHHDKLSPPPDASVAKKDVKQIVWKEEICRVYCPEAFK